MNKYVKANQDLWNTWTRYHLDSAFYDVDGFKREHGRTRQGRDALEIALLGDVAGKSLLHLQCHFGLDTITWAQRGAMVTGVDFAEAAIDAARRLADEMQVDARFVHSNVYDLRRHLAGQFDIVFTSYGVIGWLPDLEEWARVIAHFVKPGGTFCIIEGHPVANIFDDRRADTELRLLYPYFQGAEPIRLEYPGSYAAPDAPIRSVEHFWTHPIADIIGALIRAGMRIRSFAEYPFISWKLFPWMERRADGWWQFPGGAGHLPLMFSLTASRDS